MPAPRELVKCFQFLMVLAAFLLPCAATGQNFSQPKVVPTGNWPAAIYSGDVNGDGIPDLIYIDQGATPTASTTHVLLNDGKGNFTQSATLATVGTSLAIADMDGNGTADIVWASTIPPTASDNIGGVTPMVAYGTGNGTFATPAIYGSPVTFTHQNSFTSLGGFQLDHVAVGHFYATSGPLDVVFEETTLPEFFKFAGSSTYSQGDYLAAPGPIVVASLTANGYNDVVLQQGNTNIVTMLGGPSFVYSYNGLAPVTFTGLTGIHSVRIHEVNGDGRPDLIAEGANGHIDVFPGNGDGTFQTTSIGGTGALDGTTGNGGHLIATGDFNHDGLIDALTATPAGISTLLGNGTQYLGLKGIYNAGPGRTSYAVADFNGDGNLDLAVDSPEGIAILFGNADGSFQTSQAFAAGQPAMSGALGVFTSTGNVDAVVSTAATQAQLLRGNGDGTFAYSGSPGTPTPTTTQPGPAGLWSVVQAANLLGAAYNNVLDLVLTADGPPSLLPHGAGLSGMAVEFGYGNGTFSNPNPIQEYLVTSCTGEPPDLYGTSVVAPFFGGGQPNFAARDVNGFQVLADSASVPVPEYVGLPTSCGLHAHDLLAAGDLNNDGYPDLVVQTDGQLQVYLNNQSQGLGRFPNLLGDLSVDGSLTTPGQLTAPALSSSFNGPAIPTFSGGLGFPAFIGSMTIADLDRDGNQDLVVTYANLAANLQAPTAAAPSYIYIWYGSGNGKFFTSAKHPVNPIRLTTSRNLYQAAVADVNLDGIPDLILSDGYVLSVQLGKGDGTFGTETHYLAGQGINTLSVGDVNGDGKPDLVIANGGAVLTNPVANLETLATNPDVNTGGVTVLLNHATPALSQATGTVTASPEPSTYSNPFAITVTLAGQGSSATPTGTVNIFVDGNLAGMVALNTGQAILVVPAGISATLAVGTHTLSAVYSGDSNYAPATLTGTHAVALIQTSLSLLLCVDPPGSNFPCGNPISSTPLISPIVMYFGQTVDGVVVESATNLTGTITFYNGTTVFCTLNANLQNGSNTCPPQSGFFPAGTATVTVTYSGDATHSPSTSNGIDVTVLPDPATATLTSSLNPSTFGQTVTFTANVQGNYSQGIGQVTFFDGNTILGIATLDVTGSATFVTSTLAVGTHSISVTFPGSANFLSATAPAVSQVVLPLLASVQSVVSLSSSINPSAPGQSVTFTASVTAPGPFPIIPTGTVTFLDGTSALGNSTLNAAGIATFVTSTLATGSHAITASYAGSAGTIGVGTIPPPNPPKPPNPHLQPNRPAGTGFRVAGPVPHATVVQRPNPAFLVPLSPVPAPEIAKPAPKAIAPTPTILPGTSAVLTQIVTAAITEEAPGFVVTVTPVPISVGIGATAVLLVSVRDASGFSQPVQLSCAGMPNETTCNFVQATIGAGGGSTTLQVHVTAPHDCGSNQPYYVASTGSGSGTMAAFAFPGLLAGGFLLIGGRRRKLGLTILLLTVGLIGLSAVSGCGRCTDLGTKPGTYSFNVVGTAQGGTVTQVQMQSIQLTVTTQ